MASKDDDCDNMNVGDCVGKAEGAKGGSTDGENDGDEDGFDKRYLWLDWTLL